MVLTAYDIGPTQWLELFDYRRERRPLAGRVTLTDRPDQVLRALIPPLAVPREIFAELLKRRDDPERSFPQLAMTSNLLGALIVPPIDAGAASPFSRKGRIGRGVGCRKKADPANPPVPPVMLSAMNETNL